MNCLLCQSSQTRAFSVLKRPPGHYFHCGECDLIFRDPEERLSAEEEKERYGGHQNNSSEGYRNFLNPLILDVDQYASSLGLARDDVMILDYGCGPTAFFSKMLSEKNYVTENYDIFFYTNQSPLQRLYDVIVSTEVWEHFYHPAEELEQLTKLLKPKALMAIMTSGHQGEEHFQDWYYRRDPTHVIFFSEKTMRWVARKFQLKLVKSQSPYWLFQR
jgi:hypothetical protein